jgi:hypothetical protein
VSDALHERVQAAIAASTDVPWTEDSFDALCAALFAHQFERSEPLRRLWSGRGVTPGSLRSWLEVPPVPTDVFKHVDLCAFAPAEARAVFLTSGTTIGTRGRHLLRRVDTYEASLAPWFDRFLGADRPRILVLAPSADEDPASSLSHMLSWAVEHRGGPGSGVFWRGGPDLRGASRAAAGAGPVLLLGTARALFALLEGDEAWALPPGSRVMETGGFKGASIDLEPAAFRARLAERLGLPTWAIVSEYGMTELGSQGYHRCWVDRHDGPGARRFAFPPWCRVRAMDPATLAPLPDGERGLLCFWDLANVDSVVAVQTADVGIVRADGVELFGRAAGATPRGCSLAVDEILRARA